MSTKISFFSDFFFLVDDCCPALLIGFWMAVLATVDDLKNLGFHEVFFFCPGAAFSCTRIGSLTMSERIYSVETS